MPANRRGDLGQGVAMSIVRRRHPGAAPAMRFRIAASDGRARGRRALGVSVEAPAIRPFTEGR